MPDPATRTTLTGWGRNRSADCAVLDFDPAEPPLSAAVRNARPGGLLARGLGRAYGDAALNSGGAVLARLGPDRPPVLDEDTATVRVFAGTSLGDLLSFLLPRGWMLPVVPGTRHVTVGGAIAADIHGKNHHRDSSFGAWTEAVDLLDGSGRLRLIGPDQEPELFRATLGGMGGTGVILAATLRVVPVETAWIRVRRTRHLTLGDLLAALAVPEPARYQVAWVDGVRGGGDHRRSVLEEGEAAKVDDLPGNVSSPLAITWPRALPAPGLPLNPLRSPVPRLLNTAWWHRGAGPDGETVPLDRFFFPLDRIAGWNRIYGPRGFVQYQFVVPWPAAQLVSEALDALTGSGHPPLLVVVKAMGEGTGGQLSFPMPGVTAAIDVADTGSRLRRVLAGLDAKVAAAGGRIYLAKDSMACPADVAAMYPSLPEWRGVAADADPRTVFQSDLMRRLALR